MNILIGAAMYNDLCLFVKLTVDLGGGAVGKNVGPASGRLSVPIPAAKDVSRKIR